MAEQLLEAYQRGWDAALEMAVFVIKDMLSIKVRCEDGLGVSQKAEG